MVEAAVADVAGLEAGRARDRPRRRRASPPTRWPRSPSASPGAELFTIVGDDAAAGLTTWERYDEVVARSTMVVVDRPGEPVQLPDDFDWIRVEVPRLEVSSTDLRARFARRPPARLPGHRPGAPGDRRPGACTRSRRDGLAPPSPPLDARRHRGRRRRDAGRRRCSASPVAVTLYNSTEGADAVGGRPRAGVPGDADRGVRRRRRRGPSWRRWPCSSVQPAGPAAAS